MFDIDFKIMVKRLVPYFLYKETLRDYLFAAIKGLETTHGVFKDFRTQSIRDLQFTGQTIYLEHILNDEFDPGTRGIYIDTINVNQFNYLFRKIEGKTPLYLFRKSEGAPLYYGIRKSEYGFLVDFIVYVPVAVVFDSNQMKALINKYKLAGKRYKIETY